MAETPTHTDSCCVKCQCQPRWCKKLATNNAENVQKNTTKNHL